MHPALAILESFVTTPPLLLLVALLLEAWLPLPQRWKPSALQPIIQKLHQRVFQHNQSLGQQRLTGFLFPWIIVLPLTATVWAVRTLAPWPYWFDLIVLIWCLESQPIKQNLQIIQRLLQAQKRSMARLQLAQMVLRSTGNLSELGICKAAVEMSILRWLSQWWTPAFAFILFGIHGAIWVRMLQIVAQSSNLKLSQYRFCGELAARLLQTFLFIPALVAITLLMIHPRGMRNIMRVFQHIKYWPAIGSGLLLNMVGSCLNLSLGGPRYYQNVKYRYPRLGGAAEPGLMQLMSAYRLLMTIGWIWWLAWGFYCAWRLYGA
jgi:adenosylcobinamide-phosphate synthase